MGVLGYIPSGHFAYVRFESKAEIPCCTAGVRLPPESGYRRALVWAFDLALKVGGGLFQLTLLSCGSQGRILPGSPSASLPRTAFTFRAINRG